MGAWTADSKTNVATMEDGDFRHNEKSVIIAADDELRIQHVAEDGTTTVLRESVPVLAGAVIDGTVMHLARPPAFPQATDARATARHVPFPAHPQPQLPK